MSSLRVQSTVDVLFQDFIVNYLPENLTGDNLYRKIVMATSSTDVIMDILVDYVGVRDDVSLSDKDLDSLKVIVKDFVQETQLGMELSIWMDYMEVDRSIRFGFIDEQYVEAFQEGGSEGVLALYFQNTGHVLSLMQ